jgi:alcohol dehydrogenase class IV
VTIAPFRYFQPTELIFGAGTVDRAGEVVGRHGTRCLIVSVPARHALADVYRRIKSSLEAHGIRYEHFDGVVPNPTTDCVTEGAALARSFGADVVLGVGGGSSMDVAKAIAVEAVHDGSAWDYLFFRDAQPTDRTLPIVTITTTSGTGSHVTQVAVISHPRESTKSALYHEHLYPRVSIVDPELVESAPKHVTATTGFDVFCHAFESYIHGGSTPFSDLMALEAMRLVAAYLPRSVLDGRDKVAREHMAWADTLAGLCIANAGVTLPHGIAMTISGRCPFVAHGEALAFVYPQVVEFSFSSAVQRFATMARILDPELAGLSDEAAAERSPAAVGAFLKKIGLWINLRDAGVSEEDLVVIADHSRDLPDYKNNPRIAERDDIYQMLLDAYEREPSPAAKELELLK